MFVQSFSLFLVHSHNSTKLHKGTQDRSKGFVGNKNEKENLRNNVIMESKMGMAVLAAINASFKSDHEYPYHSVFLFPSLSN